MWSVSDRGVWSVSDGCVDSGQLVTGCVVSE